MRTKLLILIAYLLLSACAFTPPDIPLPQGLFVPLNPPKQVEKKPEPQPVVDVVEVKKEPKKVIKPAPKKVKNGKKN